jgi:urate oxidase
MLGRNRYGKSRVRIFKVLGPSQVVDLDVQILLEGDFGAAHTEGDNSRVIPTDTMRNTSYVLAQEHLTSDLEGFAVVLADHFVASPQVVSASIELSARSWSNLAPNGFVASSGERRLARVKAGAEATSIGAGIEDLLVLKTTGSAFTGFPRDQYTTLPEAEDRLLATSITASWDYGKVPADTTVIWEGVRDLLIEHFFGDWSASVQHQGYLMGEAVLGAYPEITRIEFRMPNKHHLPAGFERMGVVDRGTVFMPVDEPHGDISLEVTR